MWYEKVLSLGCTGLGMYFLYIAGKTLVKERREGPKNRTTWTKIGSYQSYGFDHTKGILLLILGLCVVFAPIASLVE